MRHYSQTVPGMEGSSFSVPNATRKNGPLHQKNPQHNSQNHQQRHQHHHHEGNAPQSTVSTRARRIKSADTAADQLVQELRRKGYDPETGGNLLKQDSYFEERVDEHSIGDRYGATYEDEESRYGMPEGEPSYVEEDDWEDDWDEFHGRGPDSFTEYTRGSTTAYSRFSSYDGTDYSWDDGADEQTYETRDQTEYTAPSQRGRGHSRQVSSVQGRIPARNDSMKPEEIMIAAPSSAKTKSTLSTTKAIKSPPPSSKVKYVEPSSVMSGNSESTEDAYVRLVDDAVDRNMIRGKLDARLKELERKKRKIEALARRHRMEEKAEAAAARQRAYQKANPSSPRHPGGPLKPRGFQRAPVAPMYEDKRRAKSRSPPRRRRGLPKDDTKAPRNSSRSPIKSRSDQSMSPPKNRRQLFKPTIAEIPAVTVPTNRTKFDKPSIAVSAKSLPGASLPQRPSKDEEESSKHFLFRLKKPNQRVGGAPARRSSNAIDGEQEPSIPHAVAQVSGSTSTDSISEVLPMLGLGNGSTNNMSNSNPAEFGLSNSADGSISIPSIQEDPEYTSKTKIARPKEEDHKHIVSSKVATPKRNKKGLWGKKGVVSKASAIEPKSMPAKTRELADVGLVSREELFDGLKKDGFPKKNKRWTHHEDKGSMVGKNIKPSSNNKEEPTTEALTDRDWSVVSRESECQAEEENSSIEKPPGSTMKKIRSGLMKRLKSPPKERTPSSAVSAHENGEKDPPQTSFTVLPPEKSIRLQDLARLRTGVTGNRVKDSLAPVSVQASIGSSLPSVGHSHDLDGGMEIILQQEQSNSKRAPVAAIISSPRRFPSPRKALLAIARSIRQLSPKRRSLKLPNMSSAIAETEKNKPSGTANTQISREKSAGRKMVKLYLSPSKTEGQEQETESPQPRELEVDAVDSHSSSPEDLSRSEARQEQVDPAQPHETSTTRDPPVQIEPLSVASAPGRIAHKEKIQYPKRTNQVLRNNGTAADSLHSSELPRELPREFPRESHSVNRSGSMHSKTSIEHMDHRMKSDQNLQVPVKMGMSLAQAVSCGCSDEGGNNLGFVVDEDDPEMDSSGGTSLSATIDESQPESIAQRQSTSFGLTEENSPQEMIQEEEENRKEVRFSENIESFREIPSTERKGAMIEPTRRRPSKSKDIKPKKKHGLFSSFIRRSVRGKAGPSNLSQDRVSLENEVAKQRAPRFQQTMPQPKLRHNPTTAATRKPVTSSDAFVASVPKAPEEVEEGIELIARRTKHGKNAILIARPGVKPKVTVHSTERLEERRPVGKSARKQSKKLPSDNRRGGPRFGLFRSRGKGKSARNIAEKRKAVDRTRTHHMGRNTGQRNSSPLTTATHDSASSLSTNEERSMLRQAELINKASTGGGGYANGSFDEASMASRTTNESEPLNSLDSLTIGSATNVDTHTDVGTNITGATPANSVFTMTGAGDIFSWLMPRVFAPVPVPKESSNPSDASIVITDDQWQGILVAVETLAQQFRETQKMEDDGSISIAEDTIQEVNDAISVFKSYAAQLGVNEKDLMLAVRDDDRSLNSVDGSRQAARGTEDRFVEMFEYYFAPAGPGSSYGAAMSAASTATQLE